MKTRKMRLIALMITLAAAMTGVNAEAQRRETSTQRNTSKNEVRQVKGSKHSNDKQAYQSNDWNKQLKNSGREYRGSNSTSNADRNHREYYSNRDYKPKGNAHWNKSAKYSKKHKYSKKQWNSYYKHDRKYAYHHPKYGNVYKRFHVNPVRIHHHAHGDYYFYGGHYYRHQYGIGYVRIEIPRHMVFNHLPFQCELVRVGPHVYYRYGNVYFERYGHGYRLAPSIGIQFSAHF